MEILNFNLQVDQLKKQVEHERSLNTRLQESKAALEKEMRQFVKSCQQLDSSKSAGLTNKIKEDILENFVALLRTL
jgi:phage regulator Rha-like protein